MQYCIYADLTPFKSGWVRKSPKLCWRNIWMVPKKLFVIRHRPRILVNSWWILRNMAHFLECKNVYNTNWIGASVLQFPIFLFFFKILMFSHNKSVCQALHINNFQVGSSFWTCFCMIRSTNLIVISSDQGFLDYIFY